MVWGLWGGSQRVAAWLLATLRQVEGCRVTTLARFLLHLPAAAARDLWLNLIDPAARWARDTGDDD